MTNINGQNSSNASQAALGITASASQPYVMNQAQAQQSQKIIEHSSTVKKQILPAQLHHNKD
jgi:hypothetical protein